jgi:Domain of unknown function (DUF4062)
VRKSINVFISSAIHELEYEREIAQQTLERMNVSPILFELFPALSQSPTSAYLDEVRGCDIFIILLWKSFRPAVEQEYAEAINTNKPVLVFVKSLIENEERDDRLKAFLQNIIGADASSPSAVRRTVFKNYRRLSELAEAIRESVTNELVKFYREPFYTLSREEMYELGTSIIQNTQKRLYILQQTPSLFLGARDYLASEEDKRPYEKVYLDALINWLRSNCKSGDKEFLLLFSVEAIRKEIDKEGLLAHPEYIGGLKERIASVAEIEAQSHRRFRFSMISLPFSGPMIVGDNRYGIWILGGDEAVSISQEDNKFCDILARILRVHSHEQINITELLGKLGIT